MRSGGDGYGLDDRLGKLEAVARPIPAIRRTHINAELKMFKRLRQGSAERSKRNGTYKLSVSE